MDLGVLLARHTTARWQLSEKLDGVPCEFEARFDAVAGRFDLFGVDAETLGDLPVGEAPLPERLYLGEFLVEHRLFGEQIDPGVETERQRIDGGFEGRIDRPSDHTPDPVVRRPPVAGVGFETVDTPLVAPPPDHRRAVITGGTL